MPFRAKELIGIFFFPLLVFLLNAFLSWGIHIYILLPWFDIPMHFLGGVSIGVGTAMAFRVLQDKGLFQNTPFLLRLFLLVSVVALAAVLWEFAEFLGDQALKSSFFQESLTDTMADLAFGLLGGMIAGWYMLVLRRGVAR